MFMDIYLHVHNFAQDYYIAVLIIMLVITNCKIILDSKCVSLFRFSNNIKVSIIYFFFKFAEKEKGEDKIHLGYFSQFLFLGIYWFIISVSYFLLYS